MEWVVTTGKTVEEAKERALDQLGVAGDEAEFEVLEEPKVGFLGLRKGDARVRARVRPSQPRPKAERRDRNRRDKRKRSDRPEGETTQETSVPTTGGGARAARFEEDTTMTEPAAEQTSAPSERPPRTREASGAGVMPHEEHVEAARTFVEGLVGAFGLTGSVEVHSDEDESVIEIQGEGIGILIGPDGRTAEAIGDLSRSAVLRKAGSRDTEGRVTVDVAGLRERRRAALEQFARAQAEAVRNDGIARVLEPMGSADRKIVHDALIDADGVQTLSEGEDPSRRVVIVPAS